MGFQYNIFDGALAGEVNSQPDIKLSEAAMIENSNVIIQDGEIKTSSMRLLEGVDNNDNQIFIPEFSFDIISVDAGTQTIIFDGTGSGLEATDNIYLMNNFDDTDPSVDPQIVYNDGNYTVSTVNEGGGNTTVTVVESISNDSTTGYAFVGTTDATEIKSLLLTTGAEEIFIFTKNNIYQWVISGLYFAKLTLPYDLNEDISHWSITQGLVNFGTTSSPDQQEGLIACNGVGRPVKIDVDGTVSILLTVIDGSGNFIDIASHCIFFENYLLIGNITLNTGDQLINRFYNSDLLDTANFKSNDASFFNTEGSDGITVFGKEKDNLIIFKTDSIIQCFFTGTSDLFQLNKISNIIGCIAHKSIINDRNNFLYFFGTDKRFKALRGLGDITNIIEKTMRNIKDTLISGITGAFVRDDNRLIWAIPEGADATGNNKLIMIKDGVWSFLDIEVSTLATIRKVSTDTWETVNRATNWVNVVGNWDTVQGEEGQTIILASDYNGNLSTLFNSNEDYGSVFTSSVIISTDLNKKKALNVFKRITKIRFYFKPINPDDTINISVSKDNSTTYNSLTSFSAYSVTEDLTIVNKSVSIRAKSFRIKIHSTDLFSLIGLIIYGETYGDR